MSRKSEHPQERVRPVKLVWNAEQGRLVEVDTRSATHKMIGKVAAAATKVADKLARRTLLRESNERLSPAIAKAMDGYHFGLELTTKEVSLPIEHKVTDKSHGAIEESYQMRGTAKTGEVILTRAAGLWDNLVAHARREARAKQQAAAGRGWHVPDKTRKDRPVADPRTTLYLVAPEDLARAKEAGGKVWGTFTEEDAALSRAVLGAWGMGIMAKPEDLAPFVHELVEMDQRPSHSGKEQ